LDFAASMTSHAEIPNRSHITANSFANAMLTARNVFSCNFAVSATIGEDTGCTVSTIVS
jgi:hypothetical protein